MISLEVADPWLLSSSLRPPNALPFVPVLFLASFSTIHQVLDAVADVWLVMFFLVIFIFTCAAKAGLSLNVSNSCPSMCKCTPEETILCQRAGLKTLPGEIAASTISLNLSNNYLRTLNTNTFRNLTFLHSLWLDGNNLTFLTPGTFHALSRLQELHLSRNSRLTYLHANTFRGLLNLISLDLSHCNIFEIHPLLFSHLPSLERLDLASNNMRYVPQAFRNLSSLTRLSLEGNHIEAIGRDSLKDLGTLYDLNLRKNRIWIIQNGAFTKLLRLGTLNLGHNFITDLPNQQLPNLRNLYLNNNQISSISDSAFLHLNKLHFLHLSRNNLSSLPVHLFSSLAKLQRVLLWHNPWSCDCSTLWLWRWASPRAAIEGDGLYKLCLPACSQGALPQHNSSAIPPGCLPSAAGRHRSAFSVLPNGIFHLCRYIKTLIQCLLGACRRKQGMPDTRFVPVLRGIIQADKR
uniref:LRRNT domain-containing protein n=1 Tax=Ficedula albicollis TaxID=59894 RepID=U3JGH9_FICAL